MGFFPFLKKKSYSQRSFRPYTSPSPTALYLRREYGQMPCFSPISAVFNFISVRFYFENFRCFLNVFKVPMK